MTICWTSLIVPVVFAAGAATASRIREGIMALIAEALSPPAAIFRKLRRVFECISSPLFVLIANAPKDHA
jgi:hypothetical protein